MSQGTSMEAAASASQDEMRSREASARASGHRVRHMRKCNMRAVVAAADAAAAALAGPSPKGPLTASLANAPPVSGKPPRLSASSPATISVSDRRCPLGHGDADGQEQRRLHQHVVGRIEGGVRRRPSISAGQTQAKTAAITPIWLMLE